MRLSLRYVSGLFVLLILVMVAVPTTQAALILVDPGQPTRVTDNTALYNKITALRTEFATQPLSPISPDDKSILAAVGRNGTIALAFTNLQDGTLVKVKFTQALPALSEFGWFDNQTVVYVSVAGNNPVLVALDRSSGTVKTSPLALPGFPVSLSPNGQHLLVSVPVQSQAQSTTDGSAKLIPQADPLKSPFTQVAKLGMADSNLNEAVEGIVSPNISPLALRNLEGQTATTQSITSTSLGLASLDLTTGKLTPMFVLSAGTIPYATNWSPDSSHLALTRIFNIGDVGEYSGGQNLGQIINQDTLGLLPPEQNPILLGNGVDTFDFTTNTPHLGLLKPDKDNLDFFNAANWSTDNQTLLVQMKRPTRLAGRPYPIYFVGESTYLRFYTPGGQLQSTLDREEINAVPLNAYSSPYFISPNELLINATRESNNSLYYYNRTTDEFRQLPLPDGAALFTQVTHHSKQAVFLFTSFVQAPELFRINADGTNYYQITAYNNELTKAAKVRADKVSFTLANGQVRTGYLLQQAGAVFPPNKARLIVWQEGGPTGAMFNQWGGRVENPFNILTNFGFAILFVPLEGRVGYGPARLNALVDNQNFGSIDIDEQAEIVQQTIQQGWTAPGSVGITGCSYGGYFTSQSIIRHPELYSAANSQCTLADYFTEAQFDQTAFSFYLLGRTPTTDPATYVKVSPLFNSSKVRTPTLFFHGVDDFIPIQTVVNFHDQIKANGVAVNLMAFNHEGHGLKIGNNQLIAAQAQVLWFDQFLAKPGQTMSTSNADPFKLLKH